MEKIFISIKQQQQEEKEEDKHDDMEKKKKKAFSRSGQLDWLDFEV